MQASDWTTQGPKLFGYQPGWLWWGVAFVLLVAALFWGSQQMDRQERNRAYLHERATRHATEQGLDLELVYAVIEAESGWDWKAKSGKNAKGLMQVTPIALEDVKRIEGVGGGDLYEVDYNLRVGTLYLAYLLDRFDGERTLAIAAYHMGPTAVAKGRNKYPGLSPDALVKKIAGPQTRAYVQKVLGLIGEEE